MKQPRMILEKIFVVILIAMFFTPLVIGVLRFSDHFNRWFSETVLNGCTITDPPVAFSPASVSAARYQASLASEFNRQFAGRTALIRWANEIHFRLFKVCSMNSEYMTVGRNHTLYETAYLREYFIERPGAEEVRSLVREIKRMQDGCERLGIGFALLITPCKPAIQPEDVPDAWLRRFDPRPRSYDRLIPLLKENRIRFVDGHALCIAAKAAAPVPMFPKGGTHWGAYAVAITTNALLAEFRTQGRDLRELDTCNPQVSTDPTGSDSDLLDLMNLTLPWHYPVFRTDVNPRCFGDNKRPHLVMVGGSFMWQVAELLDRSRQFSTIDCHFYYRLSRKRFLDGIRQESSSRRPLDFDREIFAADCLVLELNEQVPPGRNHLRAFASDALACLPDPTAPKLPFAGELRMPYRWGEPILFGNADPRLVDTTCLTGFSGPEPTATWTEGREARITLGVQPPEGDLIMEADVCAFLDANLLPAQQVRVSVNGHAVEQWKFNAHSNFKRRLVIPRELVAGREKLVLEFRIAHPCSPKECGQSGDPRKLGLSFSNIVLRDQGSAGRKLPAHGG